MAPIVSLIVSTFAATPAQARAILRGARVPLDRVRRGRRRYPWRVEIGIVLLRMVMEQPALTIGAAVGALLIYLFLLAEALVWLIKG